VNTGVKDGTRKSKNDGRTFGWETKQVVLTVSQTF